MCNTKHWINGTTMYFWSVCNFVFHFKRFSFCRLFVVVLFRFLFQYSLLTPPLLSQLNISFALTVVFVFATVFFFFFCYFARKQINICNRWWQTKHNKISTHMKWYDRKIKAKNEKAKPSYYVTLRTSKTTERTRVQ